MARKIVLSDDLDHSTTAVETKEFSLFGKWYEIDLSKKNQEALLEVMEPFTAAARPAGRRVSRNGVRPREFPETAAERATRLRAVREFGRANGWPDLSSRGRIPHALLREYEQANSS